MLLDQHHVGHERRTYVLAGRVSHRENDELAGEEESATLAPVLVRPLALEIVEEARVGSPGSADAATGDESDTTAAAASRLRRSHS